MAPARSVKPWDRLARVLDGAIVFGLDAIPLTVAWTVAGVHIAAGLAAVAAVALGLARGIWRLRRTVADAAMIALAVTWILATWTCTDRAASAFTLRKLLLLPLVQLGAATLATPRRARTALRLYVVGLALAAVVAMAHFLLVPHAADARLRSTGHYMTFAGLLLLAWPPCAGAACTTRGRRRVFYGVGLVVLAGALLLGFTRGAWIGSVVAAGVMLLRVRPRLALLVPLATVVVVLLLPPAYRARALSSFHPSHPTNVDRVRLWRAGWAIWRDHPWTGVGLVDLKPYYLQYRTTTEGAVHGHLHDNWIQVAVTTGTLGLLAFAWLMVAFGRLAWTAGRAGPDPELHGLGLGLWGSFWGFQTMGLFEWNFGDVEVTIALCFLFGVGLAAAVAGRSEAGGSGSVREGAAAQGLSK